MLTEVLFGFLIAEFHHQLSYTVTKYRELLL